MSKFLTSAKKASNSIHLKDQEFVLLQNLIYILLFMNCRWWYRPKNPRSQQARNLLPDNLGDLHNLPLLHHRSETLPGWSENFVLSARPIKKFLSYFRKCYYLIFKLDRFYCIPTYCIMQIEAIRHLHTLFARIPMYTNGMKKKKNNYYDQD